jgi:Tfp pilus assembly pilus retraction ATPase PilT
MAVTRLIVSAVRSAGVLRQPLARSTEPSVPPALDDIAGKDGAYGTELTDVATVEPGHQESLSSLPSPPTTVAVDPRVPTAALVSGNDDPGTALFAVFEDGTVWVRRGSEASPAVAGGLARCRLGGKPARLRPPTPVSAAALNAAYAAANLVRGTPAGHSPDTLIRIVDYIRAVYDAGGSDLRITRSASAATMHAQILGVLVHLPVDLDADDAIQLLRALWGIGKGNSGDYNSNANQDRTIDPASQPGLPWPEGLENVRFSQLATGHGAAINLRMARQDVSSESFTALGFSDAHAAIFDAQLHKPTGGLWSVGGVGSGKSRTQLTYLSQLLALHHGALTIVTIEDPIEATIPHALQVLVPPARGEAAVREAYNEAFRQVLRFPHHVIVPGEVRDLGSAGLVAEAIRIGSRLATTFHADTFWQIPPRLKGLGVPPDDIFDPNYFSTVAAMRLMPVLCRHCCLPLSNAPWLGQTGIAERLQRLLDAAPVPPGLPPWPTDVHSRIRVANPRGCPACALKFSSIIPTFTPPPHLVGLSGRTVVAEVLAPDRPLLRTFRNDGADAARDIWLKSGGLTLIGHACQKMADGLISPEDVERSFARLDIIAVTGGLVPLT